VSIDELDKQMPVSPPVVNSVLMRKGLSTNDAQAVTSSSH